MKEDERYIERCFELAKLGKGKVSPNPLVGAVLVKNGIVISEGYHEIYGSAHAEVNAIKNTSEKTKGATLYCNLEPCCHTNKKTPPCTPLIIKNGISRVVISNVDPNPFVSGNGIEQLKNAGINVTTGILSEKGKEINKFFFKFIKTSKPYVTLKIAASKDGKITREIGTQTQITNRKAQVFVHQLRAEYDAVLIGAGTVKIDNPHLTVREAEGKNPQKIIIDGNLSSPVEADIYNMKDGENTWIFANSKVDKNRLLKFQNKNCKIIQLNENEKHKLKLVEILNYLGKNGISSLLVEGGKEIFSEFVDSKEFDEIILINSKEIFGSGLEALEHEFPNDVVLQKILLLDNNKVSIYQKRIYF